MRALSSLRLCFLLLITYVVCSFERRLTIFVLAQNPYYGDILLSNDGFIEMSIPELQGIDSPRAPASLSSGRNVLWLGDLYPGRIIQLEVWGISKFPKKISLLTDRMETTLPL